MKNVRIYYGLMGGFLVTTYYALLYTTNKNLLFNLGMVWAGLAIYMFFMWRGTWIESRSIPMDEEYSSQKAIATSFAIFTIINIFYYLFYYFQFNYLDSTLVDIQYELMMENRDQIIGQLGVEEGNKYLQDLTAASLRVTPQVAFFGFARASIGGFIMSAVIGFLLKREGTTAG